MHRQLNYKDTFKVMRIIHYALLAGLLIFSALTYYMNSTDAPIGDGEFDNIFRFLAPGMVAVSIVLGIFLSKSMFANAQEKNELGDKLEIFRSGMLVRWALVEGTSLFAIVTFFLTNNNMLLLVGLAGAAYLFTLRPTPELAAAALQLTESEYQQLK